MSKRDHNVEDEPILQYGAYSVYMLDEPFEDKDGALHNYGVYLIDEGTCEATTASLPQAMSIAVSLDRAIKDILDHLEKEDRKEVEASEGKVVPIRGEAKEESDAQEEQGPDQGPEVA